MMRLLDGLKLMRFTDLTAAAFVCLILLLPEVVQAQISVSSVFPRSCMPGASTRVVINGKGFSDPMRALTSCEQATISVIAIEAEQLSLEVTLPPTVALGPLGVWLASTLGASDPVILMADDLPPVVQAAGNSAMQSAQSVPTMCVIEGVSHGPQGAFFQFNAAQNQRLAFEILSQAIESTMDPVVRLYDPSGRILLLADDDEIGPECRFSYQFEETGTYCIEVRDNRYKSGLPYHLRIGDFPILRHAQPLTATAGQATTVGFAGQDAAASLRKSIEFPESLKNRVSTVATRLESGSSSAWVPIWVSSLPVYREDESGSDTTEPLNYPLNIVGQIAEPGEKDRYPIQGVQGATVRFAARQRSLGCPTTLMMRLLDLAGAPVAQTQVADTDEWSFDFTFPDDRVYYLEATDLIGRGGTDFGYLVEVSAAGGFTLNLKPDAGVRQRFDVENDQGALVIDLQVQRLGYPGAIELELVDSPPGLRIVNPRIAAGTNDSRIYLMVDEQWSSEALALIRLRGRAVENADLVADLESLNWQRVKTPHVPFPIHWQNGAMVLSGVATSEVWFTLEPTEPIRLARPVQRHEISLNLQRLQESFKSAVALLPDASRSDWPFEIASEADVLKTTWTRPEEVASDLQSQPTQFSLLAYAEHQNRGRMRKIELPLEWFDPVALTFTTVQNDRKGRAVDRPLIAGGIHHLTLNIVRRGNDPQPVTVTFPGASERGIHAPESLEIAADQTTVSVPISLAAELTGTTSIELPYSINSTYHGQTYQQQGLSQALAILPAPQSIDIFPTEIHLTDNRDRHQMVVMGVDETGSTRDWTRDAQITVADSAIAEIQGTAVFAKADGQTTVFVRLGSQQRAIPLRVSGTQQDRPIAFENEVLVALSKQGCNSGACHGSPSGKGMFRLSLRAFDRKLDELTLIREDYGRRLNPIEPTESLLLQKPLMKVSHGGGKQLKLDDEAYEILRSWIARGAPADPVDAARCIRLQVVPSEKRVQALDAGPQQMVAIAHFSDGSQRDVTHLAAYESSDLSVATVDQYGLVTPSQRGETVILVRFLEHIESVPLMFIQQVADFVWSAPPPANYIDELVNDKLRQLQFAPSETCSDADFLRRASLDLIGILPTIEASRQFLADESPDKRARLVNELLQRDEFAKFWALKWGDLLKMTGKGVGDDGVYKYHRWVEEAFRHNMPYDQFAMELLTSSGSTLSNPAANFYRTATDMNECVENVSQVFLGARLQCAKCHNHPFERWTQDNYYGLGAFFNRVQRRGTQRPGEMFVWTASSGDVIQPRTGETLTPWLPVMGSIDVDDSVDRRESFAKWLIEPTNPYFAKMEVNRLWAQLFSRGIVDPIDDFRDSNPPSNEALLDALATDFIQSGFDRQHLLRVIMNSRTYQASSQTTPLNQDDSMYFSHQRPRLLSAEQLLDAINSTIGLEHTFGSLPPGTLATHLPAPDLVKSDFLRVFGQPERTTVCACERVDDSNLGMAIELFNGTTIHEKLRDPNARFRTALADGKSLTEAIEEIYLAAFCRYPTVQELKVATVHCDNAADLAAGLEDVCWALINTDEFLFQH